MGRSILDFGLRILDWGGKIHPSPRLVARVACLRSGNLAIGVGEAWETSILLQASKPHPPTMRLAPPIVQCAKFEQMSEENGSTQSAPRPPVWIRLTVALSILWLIAGAVVWLLQYQSLPNDRAFLFERILTKTGEPIAILAGNPYADGAPTLWQVNLGLLVTMTILPIAILWVTASLMAWVANGFQKKNGHRKDSAVLTTSAELELAVCSLRLDAEGRVSTQNDQWLTVEYQRRLQQFLSDNNRIWTTGSLFIPLSLAGLTAVPNMMEKSPILVILLSVASSTLALFWQFIADRHRSWQDEHQVWMDAIDKSVGLPKFELNTRLGKVLKTRTNLVRLVTAIWSVVVLMALDHMIR